MKKIFLSFCFSFVVLFLTSCSNNAIDDNNKIKVVTTLFAPYDFSLNIAKDKAEISSIVPFGSSTHDYEPSVNDIKKINEADIFIYTGKFMEKWVDRILNNISNKKLIVIDVSKNISLKNIEESHLHNDKSNHHSSVEPHIWTSIKNAIIMVENISDAFVSFDSQNKDFYINNKNEYINKLKLLDLEYRSLSSIKKPVIFTSHFPFFYLFNDYNIPYISVFDSFSEDSEPNPKLIAQAISKIKDLNIKYIFKEENDSIRVSDIIKKDTKTEILNLNSAHNISDEKIKNGIDYLYIMKNNLKTLKGALLE